MIRSGPLPGPTVEMLDEQHEAISAQHLADLARSVLIEEGFTDGTLSLLFVGKERIRAIKRDHLGIDEPTDVLAFPMDRDYDDEDRSAGNADPNPEGIPRLIGDVVICPEMAAENVGSADTAAESWSMDTFEDELALLVVHGVLHIAGWTHDQPESRREMRSRELSLLAQYHLNR